jgi:predicted transposase YdaD
VPGTQLWDFDPLIYDEFEGKLYAVALPEPYLLPIDDDNINKELRDELLEVKPKELVQA